MQKKLSSIPEFANTGVSDLERASSSTRDHQVGHVISANPSSYYTKGKTSTGPSSSAFRAGPSSGNEKSTSKSPTPLELSTDASAKESTNRELAYPSSSFH